jgi:hypothetical protein
MPDSAVKTTSRAIKPRSSDSDLPSATVSSESPGEAASKSPSDAENKLARAARSARRLAQLSQFSHGAQTLDLFAEDTERVLLQATNTDPRQGTLAGFELPEAFMATVCATSGIDDSASASRQARDSLESDRDAPVQIDLPVDEQTDDANASLDLSIPSDPAGSDVATTLPPAESPERPTRPALPASATLKNVARNVAIPKSAAALSGTERPNPASDDATPDLNRARATAFADAIDALYAVIAGQRQNASRQSRQMKMLLVFIGGVLAVSLLAGIAQTVALQRMNRENTLQQQRIEEMLLAQQATLASIFDTDSENIAVPNAITAAGDPSKQHPGKHPAEPR